MRLGVAVTDIGHHRDPAMGVQSDPGAAGLQVAPGDHPAVRPSRQGCSWAGMEFVAVADQDEPPMRVDAMGECDDTHARIVPLPLNAFIIAAQHAPRWLRLGSILASPEVTDSQNLRLNISLWIKLEQVSEDCCKSLNGQVKSPVDCC